MEYPLPQTLQKKSHVRTILYMAFILILVTAIVFLLVKKVFNFERPMTQEEVEQAFEEIKKNPVENTMTQEEVEQAFEEIKKNPVENTMTQEEIEQAFEEIQKNSRR